ncbi:hypothetical protein K0M31_016257 [Melipona bicolor]|uniref:Uncharacterized protein n=1 Tax=Melipona bicolor TaxID=60889 RepID=A0AA40G7F4_9HYME|nr:hypothetical protein K0M31_016257 [Melipona bicolor]
MTENLPRTGQPTWKLRSVIAAITRHNPVKAIQPDSEVRLSGVPLAGVVFFTPSSAWSAERFHVPAAAQVYHRHLLINILPEKPVTPAEGSGAVELSYRFRFGGRSRREDRSRHKLFTLIGNSDFEQLLEHSRISEADRIWIRGCNGRGQKRPFWQKVTTLPRRQLDSAGNELQAIELSRFGLTNREGHRFVSYL